MSKIKTIKVNGTVEDGFADILTEDALAFLAELTIEFAPRVLEVLKAREARQRRIDDGSCAAVSRARCRGRGRV